MTPRLDGPLQAIYRIDGGRELPEFDLPHLEGYRGTGPVRVGNGAAGQLQLDIYGELLDAAYLSNKYASPTSYDAWADIRKTILPSIIDRIGYVPIPRIEYTDDGLDLVVENLTLSGRNLFPK